MAVPQCNYDQLIKQTVNQTLDSVLQKIHSYVPVTTQQPMWTQENYRDLYDSIPLHTSDMFVDHCVHYELHNKIIPGIKPDEIQLFEQDGHLHLMASHKEGNLTYSMIKQIPLPPRNKSKITAFINNDTLVVRVQK